MSQLIAGCLSDFDACPFPSAIEKLNIAHHKSCHPYLRDNIERVRKDEEEARQKEESEDGRMMLAVSCHG